jgi:hypothetical protein
MKLQSKRNCQKVTHLLVFIFISLLSGCHKKDPWPSKLTEENANVVHDWYKLLADNFLGNADAFTIGINGKTTIYDFEVGDNVTYK